MEVKAEVLKLGSPHKNGDIFEPGCLTEVTVPVTLGFDMLTVVGSAVVHADGSGTLTLAPEAGGLDGDVVGIGFTCEAWREENGVRVLEKIKPMCLGVSVKNKGLESQICPSCYTSRLILVRSIEDTFWCETCLQWRPCAPKRGSRGSSF